MRILKELDHPNIIKPLEHFEDDGSHYIISEYLLRIIVKVMFWW